MGGDMLFRWDFLAQRLLALGRFDFYPPLTPADFRTYFFVDGIPPMVSFTHWWLYASAGRYLPPLICVFVAAQFACTLAFTYGAASAVFSRRAGVLAAAMLAASPLYFRSVVLGQETGLTALGIAATLLAELLSAAFKVPPYRNPSGGWPSDIPNLRRTQAQAFFERYYVPGNITVAIVGDVTAVDAKRLAERYFGPMAAKPMPPVETTQEPPQNGPKTVILEMPGQPVTLVGYKRPSQYDKDDIPLDLIQILLSQGRTGMLYNELVQEKRLALQAQAVATNPDGRFPNLFVFLLVPAPGHTVEETQRALEDLLQRFKSTALDPLLLARAKAQGRANLMRGMTSNRDLAGLLAFHSASYGDWRKLFTILDDLNRVSPAEVQRAANRYFVATGRTTVYTVLPGQSDGPPPPKPPERKTGGPQ